MRRLWIGAALGLALLPACGGGESDPARSGGETGAPGHAEDDELEAADRAIIAEQRKLHADLAKRADSEAFREACALASERLGQPTEPMRFDQTIVGAQLILPHRKDLTAKLIGLQDALGPHQACALLIHGMHVGKPLIALYPTADPWHAAHSTGPDAGGHEWQGEPLTPKRLIEWARDLHRRHPYRLLGASYDTLLLRFEQPLSDPKTSAALARELLAICPIFDDEDVPGKLAKHLQRERELTLFWD